MGAGSGFCDLSAGAFIEAERDFRTADGVKHSHWLAAVAAVVLSLLVPLVVRWDYELQVLFRIYLFASLGRAWNLVGGYAGQLSLGHAAYFGAGAYGLALFSGTLGMSPWPGVLMGVA